MFQITNHFSEGGISTLRAKILDGKEYVAAILNIVVDLILDMKNVTHAELSNQSKFVTLLLFLLLLFSERHGRISALVPLAPGRAMPSV